jgi:hypothetical protein
MGERRLKNGRRGQGLIELIKGKWKGRSQPEKED